MTCENDCKPCDNCESEKEIQELLLADGLQNISAPEGFKPYLSADPSMGILSDGEKLHLASSGQVRYFIDGVEVDKAVVDMKLAELIEIPISSTVLKSCYRSKTGKQMDNEAFLRDWTTITEDPTHVAYRVDTIKFELTPEKAYILTKLLESAMMDGIECCDYIRDELKGGRYEQLLIAKDIRDEVDNRLTRFIDIRPYNHWHRKWAVKIGKVKDTR